MCNHPKTSLNFWMYRLDRPRNVKLGWHPGRSMFRTPEVGTPLRAACLDAYGLASNTGLWN
jgi:hypothetical protein